ncbi:unnamed protein product, partial [Laminaria digitata]
DAGAKSACPAGSVRYLPFPGRCRGLYKLTLENPSTDGTSPRSGCFRWRREEDAHDSTAPSALVGDDRTTPDRSTLFEVIPHEEADIFIVGGG